MLKLCGFSLPELKRIHTEESTLNCDVRGKDEGEGALLL